jgi:flavin reductase (DIM6/NTAB) family NADH-FMN oxidoreductase RutF
MLFDLLHQHADRAYALLGSIVCPRPIAWVTTLHSDGSVNAAPFSFFNVIGDDPPMVMFCPGNRDDGSPKDTALHCAEQKEFVVNLVDAPLAELMVQTSLSLPAGTSELDHFCIATTASESIAVPRISDVPAALECRVHDIQEIGGNRLVIGLVQKLFVRDDLIDPATERLLTSRYHPIGRMAVPDWYCHTNDQWEIKRPRNPEA